MRKIAVFTGSRAEYGLLYWVIKGISESKDAELQLMVGGMHLSPEFGKTVSQIDSDGFIIKDKIEFLISSDSAVGISKSIGLAIISACEAFERNKPDILVILGDRFESMAIAQAAMVARIPIAHIHGGETTEGLIDEAVRHSITKMSHLHFAATESYCKRIIQLGENPEHVFNVGAPGIDNIKKLNLLDRSQLARSLDFNIELDNYMLITYHPVTLNKKGDRESLTNLFNELELHKDFKYIITYPNADTHSRGLIEVIEDFKKRHVDRVLLVKSLGQLRYLSSIKHSSVVIGNSSSGLIEVPSFNLPTINIGDRQKGRVAGETVIHCDSSQESIRKSLEIALSSEFRATCSKAINPYGEGRSSEKIVSQLLQVELEGLIWKKFYDINIE
jgi:UDP-N-acetylglucosamine 2-epimerase (non-hydrolysing)/GDP/UDP-N,N'-diacetylbacillosamine 2-epimerase (hydrolysing)